jgi:NADPH:quinone reductase-like Zn-dependent oxidoreductase
VLTRTGTLVIVGGENGGRWTGGTGRQLRALALSPFLRQRLTSFVSKERGDGVNALRAAIEAGDLVVAVHRPYRLDQAPDAVRDLESGRIRGYAVIAIRSAG